MGKTHFWTLRSIPYGTLIVLLAVIFPQAVPVDIERSSGQRFTEEKSGYPDLYAEHFTLLKTAAWETEPSYPQNYLMEEVEKSRAFAKRFRKHSPVRLPWVERGPANVGGRTRAIIVDPDDPNSDTWLAAAVSGGIWRTTDAGDSWTFLTPELPNLAVSSMAQAASNPNTIYAGTGEGFFNGDAVPGAGILKSTDRGNSWSQLTATSADVDFRFVNRLVIDPLDENVVVAATREGLFRTTDGGNTWDHVYSARSAPGVLQVIADPGNFARLFAAESGTGVLKSDDAGISWTLSSDGLSGLSDGRITNDARIEIAISPTNPMRLYAAVESDSGTDQLFMTPDRAENWVPVNPSSGSANPDWMSGAGNQGWYNNAVTVDPLDPDRVFLGGVLMFQATLNGTGTVPVLKSLDEENTDFLDFVPFTTATHFDGRLKVGTAETGATITEEEFVSVEVRFGSGLTQKAHRFIPPDGPGIPFSTYPYADYVEVPFQVWDITNNRQLAVSFRDRSNDGAFNLILRDSENLGREYLLIHAETYDDSSPSPNIATTGGPLHRLLYFMWPILGEGSVWNPAGLPQSTLRINVALVQGMTRQTTQSGNSFILHHDQHTILPIEIEEGTGSFELVVGNDGGIYHSTDQGISYVDRNRGYITSQFYGVDKRPGVNQFVGGTQDNGTWRSFVNPRSDQGWLSAFGGDGFEVAWNQGNENLVLGSIQFNDIRRSVNKGQSFSSGTSGLTDVGSGTGGQFLTSIDRSSSNPDHVYTIGESGVWKSTDFGGIWLLTAIQPEQWGFGGSGKVRVSLADGNLVWAGYEMGLSFEPVQGKLHVSTNAGETFVPVQTPEDLSSGRISSIATHPTDPNTAYVMFSSFNNPKIIRTTDLGQTWEDITGFDNTPSKSPSSNGFPDVGVNELLVLPENTNELWAGTEIGLFISKDNGATWFYSDNGLPAVSIYRMRIVDDQLIVATHGRGIWTVDTSAIFTSVAEADEALPTGFVLHQNYPNPFNPSTGISYELPQAEDVRIEIFDAIGRRVALLVDERMAAGVHQVEWDASNLASGVYISQMTAGSFVQSSKMMLVK